VAEEKGQTLAIWWSGLAMCKGGHQARPSQLAGEGPSE